MLDAIYISTSGLDSSSKGLTNISNNVANLNTPGFKESDLAFSDLVYNYQFLGNQGGSPYSQGNGANAGSATLDFTQGDFSQTGGDLDSAINGDGFFILNSQGKTSYTRDGQFTIDPNGFLVTSDDGTHVSGLEGNGVSDINISGQRSNPPAATSTVSFTNSLSSGDATFQVPNITVFDSLGTQHQLTLSLTNNSAVTPGQWTFNVLEGGNTLASGSVSYNGSGAPIPGSDTFAFAFAPGGGANTTQLTLDFSGSSQLSSSTSSLSVLSQDGRAAGFFTKATIDTDGFINLNYSNGQVVKGRQLAVATFSNLQALQAQGSNRYTVSGNTETTIGAPGQFAAGSLQVGGIELSNVNLSQEFSELIIVQRAYQSSSEVITTANEMIQQLEQIQGGK